MNDRNTEKRTKNVRRCPSNTQPLIAVLVALLFTGCSSQLNDNALTWVWGVAPFGSFLILGAAWIYWRRSSQLARWDLRTSPSPPSGKAAVIWLSALAIAVAIGFTIMVIVAGALAVKTKILNSALWWLATAVGVALAVWLGWQWAERGHTRRSIPNG